MFKHDQWVRPDLARYKRLVWTSLLLGILTFLCAGALMFTSGYLISKSATMPVFAAIYVPVVLTRGFGIGRPVFQYLERLTSHDWVLRITSHLRQKLYAVLATDAAFVQEHQQTGAVLGALSDDIGHLQNLYLRTIFPTIVAAGVTLIFTLMVGWFDWLFALWVLFLLLLQMILVPVWSYLVERSRQKQQQALNKTAYVTLTDGVLGLNDWVIGQQRDRFMTTMTKATSALAASTGKSDRFTRGRNLIGQLLFGLVAVSLIVWTNDYWTQTAGMANWVAAFVLVLFPLNQAYSGLGQAAGDLPRYSASLTHLNSMHEVARDLPEQLPLPATFETLQLKQVSFHYDADDALRLNNIDLTLHAHEHIALLGPSGMGKTTLLQLLLGDLAPTNGDVLVNEQSVMHYQAHRAQLFAVMDQQPFLFQTTIANNVRLGNEDATDDEIRQALDAVQLGRLIDRLPQGINTLMSEAGFGFSGGEQQRLALARILLQDAPIVLLDEPTVGLDPETEQALIDTIFSALADRTILWITHHLQGVGKMDRVLFLEGGDITMDGTPQHLAATNTRYQQLYALDRGDM